MSVGLADRHLKKRESCGGSGGGGSQPAEEGAEGEGGAPSPRLSQTPRGSCTPRRSEVGGGTKAAGGGKQKSTATDAGVGHKATSQSGRPDGKSNGKSVNGGDSLESAATRAPTSTLVDPMFDVTAA